MDFGDTPEQAALRAEVRQFIAENKPPDDEEVEEGGGRGGNPRQRELRRKVREKGWVAMHYPKWLGGQERSRVDMYIVEEEFTKARMGVNVGGGASGVSAAIMAAGTEEQKNYYLPKMVNGEISFALGFTEPSGGADLASLQTRAVKDGDHYVVNGQKMFTSGAHSSTHIYLMCRTDPEAPKHRGISILLIPMDTPGITVRPLWTIQDDGPGSATYHTVRTNEVFFDDVRVPTTSLLGEENRGWYVGAMGLNLDRVGAGRLFIGIRQTEDIIDFLNGDTIPDLRNDVAIRDRVAELYIESKVCRLMTLRSMSIVERGGDFTYEGSAEKVWTPEHAFRSVESICQMLGPWMQLTDGPYALLRGQFGSSVRGAYLAGVNHGSTQVMRDQVAVRGLNLPRPS
jgi:alkylation response protein AidB-like acyl-CoA dehydrogenase